MASRVLETKTAKSMRGILDTRPTKMRIRPETRVSLMANFFLPRKI